jgi:hypothetical protein
MHTRRLEVHGSMSATLLMPTVSQSRKARREENGSSLPRVGSCGRIGVCVLSSTFSTSMSTSIPANWIDFLFAVDVVNRFDPKVLSTLANPLPKDDNRPVEKVYLVEYDNSKGKRILGLDYIDEYQCAADMVADFAERGW